MDTENIVTIDRARAYGDGLFETIAIRGGKARFWDLHMGRLQTGCTKLGIDCPAASEVQARLDAAIADSNRDVSFASARLMLSAGKSERGYRRAANVAPELSIDVFPSTPLSRDIVAEGVAARKCELRLAEQPALAGIKSLNRLEQVLARAEWDDPRIFEGLLHDTSDRLICGTMSNVFAVIDSTVCTPKLDRCGVAGVMRAHLLQLLEKEGTGVDVRDINAHELVNAAELFLTNSQFGVLPIRSLDGTPLSIGPVTRLAQSLVAANGVPESSP